MPNLTMTCGRKISPVIHAGRRGILPGNVAQGEMEKDPRAKKITKYMQMWTRTTMMMTGKIDGENLFVQHKKSKKGVVDKNYLLLNNQSTVNQVANPNLLKNIRKGEKPIIVHCNTGLAKTNLIGELGWMTVHHNPRSIMNVLSLKSVMVRHCVTHDSKDCGGVFQVHTPDGIVEFKQREHGLHYLDTAELRGSVQHMLVTATGDHEDEDSKDEEEGSNNFMNEEEGNEDEGSINFVMVNIVRKNVKGFTKYEIKVAQEARRHQGMIENSMDREFTGMVHEKLIANCPVTVHDVQNANQIFGPDLANLRGKTARSKLEHVRVDHVEIPWDIVEMHKYVMIMADVMFVNGLPILVTSSRGISLISIEFLPLRTAKCLASIDKQVVRIYGKAGFTVQTAAWNHLEYHGSTRTYRGD